MGRSPRIRNEGATPAPDNHWRHWRRVSFVARWRQAGCGYIFIVPPDEFLFKDSRPVFASESAALPLVINAFEASCKALGLGMLSASQRMPKSTLFRTTDYPRKFRHGPIYRRGRSIYYATVYTDLD